MTTQPVTGAGTLPAPVRDALRAAATICAGRGYGGIDPQKAAAERDGIAVLLKLLQRSGGLRAAARAAAELVPGGDEADADLAWRLTDPDPAVATRAADRVRVLLDEQRRAARRDRREQGRAGRAPAERRREQRAQARLTETRTARDQAVEKANAALAEARELRARVAELADEVAELAARVDAADARLAVARRDAADPLRAAATLAGALAPHDGARDARGIGPGEPGRVDPGRPVPAAAETGRLVAAAVAAGLPPEIAETAPAWLPGLLDAYVTPPRHLAQVVERDLRVDVLGGGTEIGGSCVLVTAGATRLLVDAGSRPGGRTAAELAPPGINEALAGPLHAVVVTHAHADHAGWVPALLAHSPGTPVITTEATAALLATMWPDAAKVLARRHTDGQVAPFGQADVQHALRQVHAVAFGRRHEVGELEIELFPAGHVVGAAGVVVRAGQRRVVVSGDVSRDRQRTVGGIRVPEAARGADLLVLESTYAASGRMTPRAVAAARLVADVATVTSAGGRVLIPAFALGRAQEVALTLADALPDVDILIDGLARAVSAVYEQQEGPDGAPMPIFGPKVRAVPRGGTRAAVASLRSGVVITPSGMLTAGPALSWARELLPDPRAGLMVVGYQDEDSPGARLIALAEAGGGSFELPNPDGPSQEVRVAAQVRRYGLGAHATADELVTITAEVGAAQVMLVHGEPRGQQAFAARLGLRGQATVPTGGWRWEEGID